MRIGVLGTGDVGRALSTGFAGVGHTVKVGTRDPGSDTARAILAVAPGGLSVGSFAEAAEFGDVVVLATRWSGTEHAVRMAEPRHFATKPVIDCTNPLAFPENGPPTLALGCTDSAGEQVQRWLPDAGVVKAFNTVGHAFMVNPEFPGGPPDLFICGNGIEAKRVVGTLAAELGWPVRDIGGIENARWLEALAMVWMAYGFQTGTWEHAFKLLRREGA